MSMKRVHWIKIPQTLSQVMKVSVLLCSSHRWIQHECRGTSTVWWVAAVLAIFPPLSQHLQRNDMNENFWAASGSGLLLWLNFPFDCSSVQCVLFSRITVRTMSPWSMELHTWLSISFVHTSSLVPWKCNIWAWIKRPKACMRRRGLDILDRLHHPTVHVDICIRPRWKLSVSASACPRRRYLHAARLDAFMHVRDESIPLCNVRCRQCVYMGARRRGK